MRLDSDQGRIGPLWWVNSDPQPRTALLTLAGGRSDLRSMVKRKTIRWGTFGIGWKARINMEVING